MARKTPGAAVKARGANAARDKGKGGRPKQWDNRDDRAAVIEAVCADIAEAGSLTDACAKLGVSIGTVLKWTIEDEEFAKAYARARQIRTMVLESRLIEVAAKQSMTQVEAADNRRIYDAHCFVLARLHGDYAQKTDVTSKGKAVASAVLVLPDDGSGGS